MKIRGFKTKLPLGFKLYIGPDQIQEELTALLGSLDTDNLPDAVALVIGTLREEIRHAELVK